MNLSAQGNLSNYQEKNQKQIDELNLCKEQIEKSLHWVGEEKQFFQQNKRLDQIAQKYNELLKEIESINKLEEEIFKKLYLNQQSEEQFNEQHCCFPPNQQKTNKKQNSFQSNMQKENKKSGLYERVCKQFIDILNISAKLTFLYQAIFQDLAQQIKNNSENNSGSETNKQKIKKNHEVNPIAFLLSQRESDKSFIMNSLYPNEKTQFYQKYSQIDLRIDIIDTEPFEFEVIDERENQIKQYQKVFRDNYNSYCCLWVAVKFERLDIMKSYFMSIYKFVRNLEVPIFLIVTDFQLSENKKQDKEDIRQKFKSFELNQIIFIDQNMAKSDLTLELRKALPCYIINTKETIFAELDPQELQLFQDELTRKFNNI